MKSLGLSFVGAWFFVLVFFVWIQRQPSTKPVLKKKSLVAQHQRHALEVLPLVMGAENQKQNTVQGTRALAAKPAAPLAAQVDFEPVAFEHLSSVHITQHKKNLKAMPASTRARFFRYKPGVLSKGKTLTVALFDDVFIEAEFDAPQKVLGISNSTIWPARIKNIPGAKLLLVEGQEGVMVGTLRRPGENVIHIDHLGGQTLAAREVEASALPPCTQNP